MVVIVKSLGCTLKEQEVRNKIESGIPLITILTTVGFNIVTTTSKQCESRSGIKLGS